MEHAIKLSFSMTVIKILMYKIIIAYCAFEKIILTLLLKSLDIEYNHVPR